MGSALNAPEDRRKKKQLVYSKRSVAAAQNTGRKKTGGGSRAKKKKRRQHECCVAERQHLSQHALSACLSAITCSFVCVWKVVCRKCETTTSYYAIIKKGEETKKENPQVYRPLYCSTCNCKMTSRSRCFSKQEIQLGGHDCSYVFFCIAHSFSGSSGRVSRHL